MTRNYQLKPKQRSLNLKLILLLVVVVFVLAAGGAYTWYSSNVYNSNSDSTQIVNFEVKKGDTILSIAPELEAKGLIRSSDALKIYLRLNNLNPQLQAGVYEISMNLNLTQVLDLVSDGPQIHTAQVTIPEGLRMDEIGTVLANKFATLEESKFTLSDFTSIVNNPDSYSFGSEEQTFLNKYKSSGKTLEGFLFPDTYVVGADATAKDVIQLMISTLISRLSQNGINPDSDGRLANFYEVMTMASIAQREGIAEQDMKMITDVLLRRLEDGEILGSDVTVLYDLKRWHPEPTYDELQSDSPYNTRKFAGLPPTPICNPGIEAIVATRNPTPNDYNFFIQGNDGQMHYAVTYDQHLLNVELYL